MFDGVDVEDDSTGNAIQRNSMFSNGELGIDLADDGVTLNDAGDGDTGPNRLQNFPEFIGTATLLGDSIALRYPSIRSMGRMRTIRCGSSFSLPTPTTRRDKRFLIATCMPPAKRRWKRW